jgi:hypothetical protein
MSTALDAEMAAAVLEVLAEIGVTAVLSSVSRGTSSGGVRSPDVVTDTTLLASPPISMSAARAKANSSGRVIGLTSGEVIATDLYVLIGTTSTAGAAITPPTPRHDRFTIAGVTYAIWQVASIYSGDDVAVYELQLRKS